MPGRHRLFPPQAPRDDHPWDNPECRAEIVAYDVWDVPHDKRSGVEDLHLSCGIECKMDRCHGVPGEYCGGLLEAAHCEQSHETEKKQGYAAKCGGGDYPSQAQSPDGQVV